MNRPRPRTWQRRRLAWIAGLLALACATAFAAGTRRSARHRAVARDQQDQATRALWEARTAGADRWAPATLARAERAAQDALIIMQATETRLTILADFPAATSAWSSASDAARDAARQAVVNERDAHKQSEETIGQAQSAIFRIATASRVVHLESNGQNDLSRAQLALTESHILHRQGNYLASHQRAAWAAVVAERLHDETVNVAGRYLQKGMIATWHRWKTQLVARSRTERQPAILIEKADHRLTVYLNGQPVRFYEVDLGFNWISAKTYSGDAAMPEGHYRIVARKGRGESAYHRALLLNYPNDQDRRAFAKARRAGLVPPGARLGGLIEIHGSGGRGGDWTHGCVAMSNAEIDDLFQRVHVGTPVTIEREPREAVRARFR